MVPARNTWSSPNRRISSRWALELILAGKVQVNIRRFLPVEAQESGKGDVKAVFDHRGATLGTYPVRQVDPTAVAGVFGEDGVLAMGAPAAGLQGIDSGNARQVRDEGGAHAAPGAHQVAVFQRFGHQLLSDQVHHVKAVVDDGHQLGFQPVFDDIRQRIAVKLCCFAVSHLADLLGAALDDRRAFIVGHRFDVLAPAGDLGWGFSPPLQSPLPAQVGEFRQHLICCFEKHSGACLSASEKPMPAMRMARYWASSGFKKLDVAGGDHRFVHCVPQFEDGPVEIPQLFLVPGVSHFPP